MQDAMSPCTLFSKTPGFKGDLGTTPEMFFAQWHGMLWYARDQITFKTKNFATQSIVHIAPTNYLFILPPLANNAYPRPRPRQGLIKCHSGQAICITLLFAPILTLHTLGMIELFHTFCT